MHLLRLRLHPKDAHESTLRLAKFRGRWWFWLALEGLPVTRPFPLLALLILSLISCATIDAQKEIARLRGNLMTTAQQTSGCYQRLAGLPKYALLHQKLAVDTGQLPTDAQLSDTERPTPELLQLGMD
jgi:hypothetical protein